MRILHVLDHSLPIISGYSQRTKAILLEQQRLGFETFHLTSDRQGSCSIAVDKDTQLHFYRTASCPLKFNQHIDTVRSLYKRLKQLIPLLKPDILHAHSPALVGIATRLAAKHFKLPYVYECRAFWEDAAVNLGHYSQNSPQYYLSRTLESYVVQHANHAVTICDALKSDFKNRGLIHTPISIVGNALYESEILYKSQDSKHSETFVFGYIGSIYEYEGLSLLVSSISKLVSEGYNLKLIIVGGGPHLPLLKQQVSELSGRDKIEIIGQVATNQVSEYYNKMDAMVYPRLKMRLTELVTPLKPLEAMAYEKLVVASNVGGHIQLGLKDHSLLFNAGNQVDLERTLMTAMDPLLDHSFLVGKSSNYVRTEKTWQNESQRYLGVYEDCLNYG